MKPCDALVIFCIMPTHNRRAFAALAIEYFLRQDYLDSELIVVDDGTDPVEDLVPKDSRIRYVRLHSKASVGAKRNHACEVAHGSVISHWDNDEWQAPHRLSLQVETLIATGRPACRVAAPLFYEPSTASAWQFSYPIRPWPCGSSLCYRRDTWERIRFGNKDVGEDTLFVWQLGYHDMASVAEEILVAIIHGRNVAPKEKVLPLWRPVEVERIRSILASD